MNDVPSIEFLGNIPLSLYKYRNWVDPYQKRILTDNEIYLASPDQFNDPFDANLPYRYKDEDLTPENIFLKLYQIGKRDWPELSEEELHQKCFERQSSGDFESGQYWRDEYERSRKETNSRFGIMSLTSANNNLLMWSHYADCHKGFCVGFDKFKMYESISGQLGPVIYSESFPKAGIFDDTLEGFTKILITKSKEWQYEDEYRIVKIDAARNIFKLPDEAITEIVLGMKMLEEHKDEIVAIANAKFPKAKIFQSQMNLESFRLDMIPIIRA